MSNGFLLPVLASILLAIGPGLGVFLYLARRRGVLWRAFFWGWAGWLLAYLIRAVPVQIPAVIFESQLEASLALTLLYFAFASAMAGVFEESFRYFFLRRGGARSEGTPYLLAFGLGWGIGEAILLFAIPIALLPVLAPTAPTLLELLPGALERNLAIVAHVSFTLIIFAAIAGKRGLLAVAILLHFGLNMAASAAFLLTGNVWLTEGVIAAAVVGVLLIAVRVHRAGPPLQPLGQVGQERE